MSSPHFQVHETPHTYTHDAILRQVAYDLRRAAAEIPEYAEMLPSQRIDAELDRHALELAATHIEDLIDGAHWQKPLLATVWAFIAGFACGFLSGTGKGAQ